MLSKIPHHPNLTPAVAASLADFIWSLELRPTRLVITDLDNTLWAGEVAELGWDNVGLDAAGSGYPHLILQRYLLDLRAKGTLLAVASKNTEAVALEVFQRRREMLLRIEDFSAVAVNWQPKSSNIENILNELNLTSARVTFLDDSVLERTEVSSWFPDIYVPDLPESPEEWPYFLASSKMLSLGRTGGEDADRVAMYEQETERKKGAQNHASYDDFLRELQLTVTATPLSESNLARAGDLVKKTNQFNLTVMRSSESELKAIMNSPDHISYVYSLADKFGSYGNISVVILERSTVGWRIHTWVMSCRAMGRQVEYAVFRHIIGKLPEAEDVLYGAYVSSDKNTGLQGFLQSLGFTEVPELPWLRFDVKTNANTVPGSVVALTESQIPLGST
jgi:FkbH-like protein